MPDVNEFYCVNCHGTTADVLRPHTVDRNGKVIVIRDVPMHECDSCGETYLTTAVMKHLDTLVGGLLAGVADEAIVHYRAA